ncbi:MAG: hypothetical protein WC742_07045 [Gallionellaceae bacterium]
MRIDIPNRHAEQLLPAVSQGPASLLVDVDKTTVHIDQINRFVRMLQRILFQQQLLQLAVVASKSLDFGQIAPQRFVLLLQFTQPNPESVLRRFRHPCELIRLHDCSQTRQQCAKHLRPRRHSRLPAD